MLFFFFFALAHCQNVTFQSVNSQQIDLITTDYPTIVSCDTNVPFTITDRILYLHEKNWTRIKLHIILKNAEGALLSDQLYFIDQKEEEEEEEETKNENKTTIILPFVSVLVCIGLIFLIIGYFKKSDNRYISNKQKDRILAKDFYEAL